MKKQYIIAIIIVVMALLFFWQKKNLFNILKGLLAKFEGYSAKPYWDVNRYSWGYGTQAPNGANSGTISKADAMKDAINFSMQQQQTLRNYLKTSLTDKQWASLLSFSYNLGTGNGIKLIDAINTGDSNLIGNKWNSYIYSGGIVNPDLVKRRAAEFQLFNS
jgi:lysozyme